MAALELMTDEQLTALQDAASLLSLVAWATKRGKKGERTDR